MFLFFAKSEADVLINSVLRQNTACRRKELKRVASTRLKTRRDTGPNNDHLQMCMGSIAGGQGQLYG